MQIGIFAKTFAGSNATSVLAASKAAGFDCVQFNMACVGLPALPDAIPGEVTAGIFAAARLTGVEIAAVSGTYNMIHPDPAVRTIGLRRLEVLANAAPSMSTRLVTLCTGTRHATDQWAHHPDNASPAAWSDLLTEMEKALVIAEATNVDLGIEPELANVINSAGKAARLIAHFGSPRLKIILDPANLFEVETPAERQRILAHAAELLGPHVGMAHAKDRAANGDFVAAGSGVIDFADFLGRLHAVGFDGPLVTHGLADHEAPRVAAFLRQITGAWS